VLAFRKSRLFHTVTVRESNKGMVNSPGITSSWTRNSPEDMKSWLKLKNKPDLALVQTLSKKDTIVS
jgi:hypothetical protein